MAHSLEERFPFMDNDLVDFAQKIPVRYKLSRLDEMKRIDENEIGMRKAEVYSEDEAKPDKTLYHSEAPGTSKKIERAYVNAPPMIPHDISDLPEIDKKVKLNDLPDGYAVRGELIITKKGFEQIKDEMANASNAVSGLVNSKPKSINKNVLAVTKFVTYAILYPVMKQEEQMKELEKYNFDINKNMKSLKTKSNIGKFIPLICAGAAVGVSILALKELKKIKSEMVLNSDHT